MRVRFGDRADAGRRLGERLSLLRSADAVVLGVPPGGVPVAFEVARRLGAPLDVVGVVPVSAPLQPNLTIGAVGEYGVYLLNRRLTDRLSVSRSWLYQEITQTAARLQNATLRLRANRPAVTLRDRTVILVADAVGGSMMIRTAAKVARRRGARQVVLATPVISVGAEARLRRDMDRVVCLQEVTDSSALTHCYDQAGPVSDRKIRRLLAVAAGTQPDIACRITVPAGDTRLHGILTVPMGAVGLVVLVAGALRTTSPLNRAMAAHFDRDGLATLLLDLVGPHEAVPPEPAIDAPAMARRLAAATSRAVERPELAALPIGYFGSESGAATALIAAAGPPPVSAVVCCAGQTDPAAEWLRWISAPTMFIAGGWDTQVLEANRRARKSLRCESAVEVMSGTAQSLDEPAVRARIADLSATWLLHGLQPLAAAQ